MHFASYYRWLTYSFLFAPLGFGAGGRLLLDIGGKEGAFAERLAGTVKRIVCVDISLPRVRSALVSFTIGDGQSLPFVDHAFDQVVLNDVLEHIVDDRVALQEACRVLDVGGRMWLSTPALNYNVGPKWVTQRFERAWGHVRRGYTPEQLLSLLPANMCFTLFVWHEPCIRALQLPLWVISRRWMRLARHMARYCFEVDRRVYQHDPLNLSLQGHLYVYAHKRG